MAFINCIEWGNEIDDYSSYVTLNDPNITYGPDEPVPYFPEFDTKDYFDYLMSEKRLELRYTYYSSNGGISTSADKCEYSNCEDVGNERCFYAWHEAYVNGSTTTEDLYSRYPLNGYSSGVDFSVELRSGTLAYSGPIITRHTARAKPDMDPSGIIYYTVQESGSPNAVNIASAAAVPCRSYIVTSGEIICPDCYEYVDGRCDPIQCPPNSTWDPNYGGCCRPNDLPGSCDDNECINIVGPENILCNNTYKYTAYIVQLLEDCDDISTVDRIIYISYAGSTIYDYNGPTSIVLPAGSGSIDFNITIGDNQSGILNVSSHKTNGVECIPQQTNVYCEGITPPSGSCPECYVLIDSECVALDCPEGYKFDANYPECCIPPISEIPDHCCDYMPKDFISWSNGWNLRQLVPPNER